jgi:hypothetical protein
MPTPSAGEPLSECGGKRLPGDRANNVGSSGSILWITLWIVSTPSGSRRAGCRGIAGRGWNPLIFIAFADAICNMSTNWRSRRQNVAVGGCE